MHTPRDLGDNKTDNTTNDLCSKISNLKLTTSQRFDELKLELVKLREPVHTIQRTVEAELAASRQECAQLQAKLDRHDRFEQQDFLGAATKMLGSKVTLVGSPPPLARMVARSIGRIFIRGEMHAPFKQYTRGWGITPDVWYCARKPVRYDNYTDSRVLGGRCDCGGGVGGEGDAPCILLMRREGFPFQFVYGPEVPVDV